MPEIILRQTPRPPREQPGSRRTELRGRRRAVRDDEIVDLDGLLVTTPARTWIDLAESLVLPDLVAAGDWVLRAGTPQAQLRDMIRRARHRRGVVRAGAALSYLDPRSRSRPESHLRFQLVSAGLPKPQVNVAIFDEYGQWLAEPDLSYDEQRVALEYNGAEHADPIRMRRDITRDLDLNDRGGWRIVTVGPAEVFGHPERLAPYIGRLLAQRMPTRRRQVG